jgi:pimeloyl-ACP methyl ester carboxylesterase
MVLEPKAFKFALPGIVRQMMVRALAGWFCVAAMLLLVTAIGANAQAPTAQTDRVLLVPLGGLEQWISIRGEDLSNPVLLVVHGGPGEAQWPAAEIFKPWEKKFTVVQWDQRGTGHTYGHYGEKTPDVTLDRISKDGVELAAYLCRELHKKKIILLGHSWGSLVAVHMVQLRPELFSAYVGTGQVSSWAANVNSQFDLHLAKARREGDEAQIKKLEAIGRPDPTNTKQYFSLGSLISIMAPSDQAWIKHLRSQFSELKDREPEQAKNLEAGMMFTAERVLPDQVAADLPKTACDLHTAFFVINGHDDHVTPTSAAVDYFNCVKSQKKELVLIPNAGHFAWMTVPDKFLEALVSKVRPVAIARDATQF